VLFGVLFEWLPLFLLIEEKVAGDELQTGARTSRPSRWLGTITSDHVPTSFLRLFLYLPGKGLFVARLIFFWICDIPYSFAKSRKSCEKTK